MVNSKEFTNRLEKIIDHYGESASSFAEKIGVQRSSISHILSGRNKPSLDFVMKILASYPEVELYWLLNGKGTFPQKTRNFSENLDKTESPKQKLIQNENIKSNSKSIKKIMVLYDDGSFEEYHPPR